ncbi:MAG TPA: DMT family transporter [Anaeromyxobacteraceae bacterium]|nr:DMT family transporter [Anaeromyxobacteraceae bacterium]
MASAAAILLASAFLHASWNALLKRERNPEVAVAGVLVAALAVALAAAATAAAPRFASGPAIAWGVAAGAFEGLYFVTLAAALARAPYGAVYAIARGGAMLVVWPAAALLLGEQVSPRAVSGAIVIGVGLALVALSGGRRSRPGGITFAVICAASIAGYHLCYDVALSAGARESPLFALALATALPFLLVSLRVRGALATAAAPSRGAVLRWALAGVLCTASFLLFLRGLAMSGAALALTLRNTSVLFAQALAVVIGEPVGRRQLAGAMLVAAGAAIVSSAP